jgi:hypothetical protein
MKEVTTLFVKEPCIWTNASIISVRTGICNGWSHNEETKDRYWELIFARHI